MICITIYYIARTNVSHFHEYLIYVIAGSRDNSLLVPETTAYWFQRQQPTRGGTVRCHQHLQIVVNSFLNNEANNNNNMLLHCLL